MKEFSAKFIFVLIDILVISISLILAYLLRNIFSDAFGGVDSYPLSNYTTFYPLYIVIITLLSYEGIYTYRYDFWHESRLILKGIIFSALIVFAYLAMTKSVQDYSRAVIGFAFLFIMILIPLSKNISKKLLHKLGLWQKKAKIYGEDPFLTDEIYGNPYLGYIKPKSDEEPATVFINSKNSNVHTLKKAISSQIKNKHEVIFIPLIDEYDLTHSHIYELSNTRTNLIVFQNRLKSKYRRILKKVSDFSLTLLIFPLLIPLMIIISYKIKA